MIGITPAVVQNRSLHRAHHVRQPRGRPVPIAEVRLLHIESDLRDLKQETRANFAEVRSDIRELRNRLDATATKSDLAELRNATRSDLAELRNATNSDLAELRTDTKGETTALRDDLRGLARKVDRHLLWLISAQAATTAAILTVMAHGFKWI